MNPFATAAMAEGYARCRPALHGPIMDRVRAALSLERYGRVALDIGCGSGLSTRPLVERAERVVGIEPVFEMTACAKALAPGSRFVCGRGEELPFGDESVDFMTAAGSLNFARPELVLQEAHRVLTRDGVLVVYDFSQGKSFVDSGALSDWCERFAVRYPKPLSEAIPLDAAKVKAMADGFTPIAEGDYRIALRFAWQSYAAYMMTETNVAAAIRRGEPEQSIRAWMQSTLPGMFGNTERDVLFPGYWVALRRSAM